MIPSNVDPSWYETYWYRTRPRQTGRRRRRIDPALLAVVLLFAGLIAFAVVMTLIAPAYPPVDVPSYVT